MADDVTRRHGAWCIEVWSGWPNPNPTSTRRERGSRASSREVFRARRNALCLPNILGKGGLALCCEPCRAGRDMPVGPLLVRQPIQHGDNEGLSRSSCTRGLVTRRITTALGIWTCRGRDDCRALIGNPGCGDLFQRCTEIDRDGGAAGQRLAFASTSCLNLGNGTCRYCPAGDLERIVRETARPHTRDG